MRDTRGEGQPNLVQKPNLDEVSKVNALYSAFDVNVSVFDKKMDDIKDDDPKMFSLTFTEKKQGNIYTKIFSNSDLDLIIKGSEFKNIKKDQLIKLILYSLSKRNTQNDIKYDIISDKHNLRSLKIVIQKDLGLLTVHFELIIDRKLTEMELLKNELNKSHQIIINTKKELIGTKQDLRETKERLNTMEEKYSELLSTVKALTTKMSQIRSITSTVVFKEVYTKKKMFRAQGWNILKLHSDDVKQNNDMYLNDDQIILNKGNYIIKGQTFLLRGDWTQLQFKSIDGSNDGSIKLNGSYAFGTCNTVKNKDRCYVSIGCSSILLDHEIKLSKKTTFIVQVYCDTIDGFVPTPKNDCHDNKGYVYATSICIQKLS